MFLAIKLFSLLMIVPPTGSSDMRDTNSTNKPVKTEMLRIKKDSTDFIKLKSLSTSGYIWSCSIEDSSVVKVEKKENEFPATRPKRVGDSGLEVFAVKGLKSGKTKIFFTQKRRWKNGGEPIKNINYIVKVAE